MFSFKDAIRSSRATGNVDIAITVSTPIGAAEFKELDAVQKCFTAYLTMSYVHAGMTLELKARAYEAMSDVATKKEYHARRKMFAEAFNRDYAARLPENTDKQMEGARNVAWSRFVKRAEAFAPSKDSGLEKWVSPVQSAPKAKPETDETDAPESAIVDDSDGRAEGNNTGKGKNQKAKAASLAEALQAFCTEAVAYDAELVAVLNWARASGANLKALKAWHAANNAPVSKAA